MSNTKFQDGAAALYDGGWRAKDRDWLKEEYNLTDEDADGYATALAELEE